MITRLFSRGVLLFGLLLILTSVGAGQGPMAQPSPAGHASNGIPVNPPPGWDATIWDNTRKGCQRLADKLASGQNLTRRETSEAATCRAVREIQINPNIGPSISPAAKPLATPEPPRGAAGTGLVPAATSSPGYVGPFGAPVSGPSDDACDDTPPDVAADVSPTEMAEGIGVRGYRGLSPSLRTLLDDAE
jgi:hypothetical protein